MGSIGEFLVIKNLDMFGEEIYYCGDSEVDAFKRFKALGQVKKNIVRAKVYKQLVHNIQFVSRFEVLQVVR